VELRKLFVYNTTFTGLAGTLSNTQTFTIQADSDFDLQKLSYTADIAIAVETDSTRVIPLINILIVDTGTGEQLMDTAVPVNSLFGTGMLPFILPRARRFSARSAVSVTATNRTAATTYNLQLSFIGEKIYNLPGQR
jgi:hypothetical protein